MKITSEEAIRLQLRFGVTLDGSTVPLAINADEEEGWVEHHLLDDTGRLALSANRDGLVLKRSYGRVTITELGARLEA